MAIDRPDDADPPSDDPSDRSRSPARNNIQIETRSRQEYYDDLRAAVAQESQTETEPPPATTRGATGKLWTEVTGWSRRVWAEIQRKWPPEHHPPPDRSTDPPGSWRGPANLFLDRPANQEMDKECDQIVEQERERFSPAMLETESRDPDRHLVGFEYRLKGRDRIKEKVAKDVQEKGLPPKEALSRVPDTVRYTFQYEEARYTIGVHDDIVRLKDQGFKMVRLKNFWSDEQYKGINTQWVDSHSDKRFELQFHTQISFEGKQITHGAYERLRSGQADELETMVLKAFQREVSSEIPVPPGANYIPDYP